MTERKRAGSRRSLAAAASTAKNAGRRNDDSTPAERKHPQHPDQIPFPNSPTAPEKPAAKTRARKSAAKPMEPPAALQEPAEVPQESSTTSEHATSPAKRPARPSRVDPAEAVPAAARRGSKYTAVLDDDTLDAFEQLTRVARRRLGRHVDKVEIFSTLVLLAADDVSLRDQLISAVGGRETHR